MYVLYQLEVEISCFGYYPRLINIKTFTIWWILLRFEITIRQELLVKFRKTEVQHDKIVVFQF